MAVVNVSSVLNDIDIAELIGRDAFYITNLRPVGAVKGTDGPQFYTFDVSNADGAVSGHTRTDNASTARQVAAFLELGNPDDVYGPLVYRVVGKVRKFATPDLAPAPEPVKVANP